MAKSRLLEITHSESVRVDRENGVIHGVKILGRESKNGRTYSDKAMDDAARLYEGVKVNVDHPSKDRPNAERGLMEGFGELRGVKRERDGVFGDLHFLKSHPSAGPVCEMAERFPRQFGLSHNADGVTTQERGKVIVESVESVISVDIVGRPATNEGLFESVDHDQGDDELKTVKTTIRKLVESAGGVFKIRLKRLREEDVPMMDAPVEVPAEGKPEDQIKAAFRQAVMAAFDDDSLDSKATLAKIKEILKAYDNLSGETAASDAPAEGGDSSGGGAMEESVKALMARLNLAEAKEEARELLESEGIEATPSRVKLIAEAQEKNRAALIEEFKLASRTQAPVRTSYGSRTVAKPATSQPLRESSGNVDFPKDTKSFAATLKAGAR